MCIRDSLPTTAPPTDNYNDAVGDVPPEFKWDESLLDELPELNHTTPSAPVSITPLNGNPIPPSSNSVTRQGRIERPKNALEAAIRLQSLEADLRSNKGKRAAQFRR